MNTIESELKTVLEKRKLIVHDIEIEPRGRCIINFSWPDLETLREE